MTAAQIKKRVERLEGAAPPESGLQFIVLVGIDPDFEFINGVRTSKLPAPPSPGCAWQILRPIDGQPRPPLTICAHDGETLEGFGARLSRDYSEATCL